MLVSYLCCLLSAAMVSPDSAPGTAGSVQTVSARTLSGDELVRIGEIHDVQNHFPEAMTYYDQALKSFRAHKQPKGEAIVLTKIGSLFERQGRRQEAAVQLRQALALFSKMPGSPVHADALFAYGRVSLWLGDREEAAPLFERAMERYRRSQNIQAVGLVALQLGLLKVSETSSDEGIREIRQVLEDARARRDHELTLAASVALGDAHWILDQTQAARTQYEQALALLEQRPQAAVEAGVRIRVASLSASTDRNEQGLEFAKRAVTLTQSLRDGSGEAAAWTLLASLHQALGHDMEAEEALRRALGIYRQHAVIVPHLRSARLPAATSPRVSR